ncbi:acid phosphatase 1-like [Cucurbita moschata]|uniref:Acid phosphatase 1-like n=1 Tax=Cucurbita moschata TaxID=3662 RepID=A0A6J1H2M2_CUCMO|nr:acid phosphatase 1-like [Cucurbita moschata]XP_022958727.1 acid phosphatase 1-like [Cucurbita moschata]
MDFLRHFVLVCVISVAFAHEAFDSHLLPRPLILEFPDKVENQLKELDGEIKLRCDSWRFNVEANNLNPWKTIPEDCSDYVKEYLTGRAYQLEMELASTEAEIFAQSVKLVGDGKDVWVFDIDETLLSNLPYYGDHGYGSQVFNADEFDNWVLRATAPAIQPSLKLYIELMDLGFKIVLLTGRSERQREATVQNLINAGFYDWDRLILRRDEDQGKSAVHYKSEKRSEMEIEGLRIIGNSGDQWSDLLGTSVSVRSFKLPNPMYYIS